MSRKKLFVIILTISLFFIIFSIVYILFFEKNKINKVTPTTKNSYTINNITKPRYSPQITHTPRAIDYDYYNDYSNNIDSNTNLVTYVRDNNIYSRKINKNYLLGKESILAQNIKNIADYTITYDKKFIAYSYVTEEIKKGDKSEIGGSAHNVDLLNISTGATRTIYNYEPSKGQILTLTVSPYKNIIFIGTDYKRLFIYDINLDKLVEITYKTDEKFTDLNEFCIGYKVFDQSPDLSHILLSGICYEGSSYYLYNLNSKERVDLGFNYVNGRSVEKFINDGSYLAQDHNNGEVTKTGKYNYQNQLVQELPTPKIDDINDKTHKKIYYKYIDEDKNIKEYYLTSEKEIIDNKDNLSVLTKNNQLLGTGISLIKVFN